MPDLGHELRFGAFLTPSAADHTEVVRLATVADEIGLDLIGVQDHPYQPSFLDTWTLLSHLAALTGRVTLFPDVVNLPLRQPAVLARSAASLDILSGGRFELGIGAGAFWDAIVAMGGQRLSAGEAVDALAEAIAVLRALWTPGRAPRLDGRYHSLRGARPGPFPVHPIGIWVGAYKPRMLRLTASLADGWLPSAPYAPPAELAAMTRLLDAAAADAGRDPGQIRRIYNIAGRFTARGGDEFLVGPPKQWAAQLTELAVEQGVSGFVLAADGVDAERDLRTFAEEVAPLVRSEVDGSRAGSPRRPPEPAAPPVIVSGSAADPLGEAGRPRVTKPDDAAPENRAGTGHRLVLIHANLRKELREIRAAVASVAAGQRTAESARSLINQLTMRQNFWTLGSFCAAYCRILTLHHTIEDQAMYPELVAKQPSLTPVIKQLEHEHEVIAEVLTGLDAALVALTRDGAERLDEVRDQVVLLDRLLTSHLDYEEEQLVEPLNRLDLDL